MNEIDLTQKNNKSRCSVCDTVNSLEIENNPGDFRSRVTFYEDPNNTHLVICGECIKSDDISSDDYEWDSEDIALVIGRVVGE